MIERIPPQNIEAEQAVLGAMLLEKKAIVAATELLKPDDFYREAHKLVFEAIVELSQRDEAADLVTVVEQLKKNEKLDKAGGIAFVAVTIEGSNGEVEANADERLEVSVEGGTLLGFLDFENIYFNSVVRS